VGIIPDEHSFKAGEHLNRYHLDFLDTKISTAAIMTCALSEDIFTPIYSHIFDFEVLRATAAALTNNKRHPLRKVVLQRVLQLPLRLSSENLNDSKMLINHFGHNAAHANLVRDIIIVLGLSRNTIAERRRFGGKVTPQDMENAERAEALVELLPELLRHTENLRRLDWSNFPPPSSETLRELSKHSPVTHLSLDCSVESEYVPEPCEPLEAPDITAK
jgi:hypothetical protein